MLTSLAGAIPYPELLAYAQSLSSFTSAPPNMPDRNVPGPPPPLFFPPFPNEEKMRRGHMNDEAPLGLLGETHSVGKRELLHLDYWRIWSFNILYFSTNNFSKICGYSSSYGSSWCKSLQTRASWSTPTANVRPGPRSQSGFVNPPPQ